MTAREVLEYTLTELNKVEAPSLLLEDYNYFINKAIQQHVNTMYNMYDMDQQRVDNLRVLKVTRVLDTTHVVQDEDVNAHGFNTLESVQKTAFRLPKEYFHILDCIVEYTVKNNSNCTSSGTKVTYGAKRLVSGSYSQIMNNYYMKPMPNRPYYSVIKCDTDNHVEISAENKVDNINDDNSAIIEIYYGSNKSYDPTRLQVTYLKTPILIKLTQDQIDEEIDNSQLMEFPEYVCHEIINVLVKLILENSMDQRLQTHLPINQTVAPPSQSAPSA